MSPESELVADIGRFCTDPYGFARYAFPWREAGELADSEGPRDWQREIMQDIRFHLRGAKRYDPLLLSVSSGHGIGKSALIAMIVNWAMSTCEDCRIVITANTEPQLRTKTWPEISKWTRLAINSHWWNITATTIAVREKSHERLWRTDAIAWSENNTEAFAGLHNKGKRVVVIYDEASAISDRIWEVTEGALTDEKTEIIWLAFGNPTKNTGRFRECFGKYRHRWTTRQIDSRQVEGTNKQQLDKWIADYGEDSDFCRVRVRGEFPRAGSTQLIPGDIVQAARKRVLEADPNEWKIISVDVARFGDDQTIIGMRQGLKLYILQRLRGQSVPQVAMRVMEEMERQNPRAVIIDGDGIGGGVIDYIRLHGDEWFKKHPRAHLEEFHGAATPMDPHMYFNLRAEAWGKMRSWLDKGSIPDDPELDSDLTGPEYFFSSKNQIQLERKEDMKKRGLASPDLGDMLAMSFCANPLPKSEDELLAERLASIKDPFWRQLQRVKVTLDREAMNIAEDNRPEWMRDQ